MNKQVGELRSFLPRLFVAPRIIITVDARTRADQRNATIANNRDPRHLRTLGLTAAIGRLSVGVTCLLFFTSLRLDI